MNSILTKNQKKTLSKQISLSNYGYPDENGTITAEIRYDDECGNGHNSFAITGEIRHNKKMRDPIITCGCIHEDIAKHFPELVKYLPFHLCSSDGPMHYIANTVFLAGDRDCWKHGPGDPEIETRLVIDGIPEGVDIRIPKNEFNYFLEHKNEDITIKAVEHKKDDYCFKPKYTFFADEWYKCGFDSENEAKACLELFRAGKVYYKDVTIGYYAGKSRDLKAAREVAIWPEATDAQLSASPEDLEKMLIERLPGLMAEFKKLVEELGFTY